ncbi:MAG: LruC domain-containing protein [bacterium]|nr:LruC domain-containing protein [bacterium]
MKKAILALVLLTSLTAFTNAQTILPLLSAESGNRSVEQANCWGFGSISYTNIAAQLITGTTSMRSNSPTNLDPNACWIKTPWIKPTTGNITLKIKFESTSAATTRRIILSYSPYDASAGVYKEGTYVRFDSIQYEPSLPTSAQSLTFALPAAIINSTTPYKIRISFVGTGGITRYNIDDVMIPAIYWSDPSNSCLPIPSIVDKDKDGVADADDAYPEDEERAYNTDLVKEATLMFEDLWPNTGDYDFNDLVTKYNAVAVTNADNNVVEVLLNVELRAIGASFNNGFLMQFDNLDAKRITGVKGNNMSKTEWANFSDNGTENDQKYANILIFSEAFKVLPSPGGSGVNVNPEAQYVNPETLKIVISFDTNKDNTTGLKELALNPYIIVNQNREIEVHLADYMPSSKATLKLFGTANDNSNLEKGRTYRTSSNLPFALQIEKTAPHMVEKQDILKGYLKFAEWAKSNGELYRDWYSNTEKGYREEKLLYFIKGDK